MRSDCCTFLPRLRDTFDAVNVACDSDHKAAGLQVPDRCNVACATAYLPVFVGCQDIIARMDVDAFAALANLRQTVGGDRSDVRGENSLQLSRV